MFTSAACARSWASCPGTDELIRPIRGIGYFLAAETPERSRDMNRRLFWKIFLSFLGGAGNAAGCALSARPLPHLLGTSLVDPA